MKKNQHQHLVKDDFRYVTFNDSSEVTLCTDCLENIKAGVLVSIIATPYEEVQCDHCSCINSVAAYVDEIEISITREKKVQLKRTVSNQQE